MFYRPRTTICREGWYYLLVMAIVFLGAMFKEVNLLLVLGGMMLGLWFFHWQALFVSLRGLKLERRGPQAVCAGDALAVGLRLNNTGRYFGSWAVNVEEQIRRESAEPGTNHNRHYRRNHDKPIATSVFFPYIPVGEERTGTYRGTLVERGRYRLGPARISTQFPFGLMNRKISCGESETIYVYPRLGRLTRSWLVRHRKALSGADRKQRRPGPEGDFYGVREWRSGDSMRMIHWRSSARTGKLVVRQFEQPHNRDVAILTDLWLPDQPSEAQRENIELAISFAATALSDLFRQGGGKVHLGVYDGQPRCLGGPASAVLLQDMMKMLAVVEGQSKDRLPQLIEQVLANIAAGTEIILISTRPVDLSDADRFAAVLSDASVHASARNIRSIDVSSDELEEYFTVQ